MIRNSCRRCGIAAEHATAQGLLDVPDVVAATVELPPLELPGTQIGPYKLLEQIGEGGMGVVYHASQREPVRRTVALKIIKPGMDSREVVTRFEAERQALAMMDHPNIAKVFDGGVTDAGRPYFAMELVKGTPITEYCDRRATLDPRAAGVVRRRLPRRAARASERRDPPRSQAEQLAGRSARRPAGPQDHRLWHRQSHGPATDRAIAAHGLRVRWWGRRST